MMLCVFMCSMDGFRVVKLNEVSSIVDIVITATGRERGERREGRKKERDIPR